MQPGSRSHRPEPVGAFNPCPMARPGEGRQHRRSWMALDGRHSIPQLADMSQLSQADIARFVEELRASGAVAPIACGEVVAPKGR